MSISLKVEKRAVRPRSLRNQLRHSGYIPAVVYGYKIESTPISFEAKALVKILKESGVNSVISLTINGEKRHVLISKTQVDTFTAQIKHVEFLSVNMRKTTEVEAEIKLIGTSEGVKAGGVLNQNLYNVLVSATPNHLPEYIPVDITSLKIGDSLLIGDLPVDKHYDILTDKEEQILTISEKPTLEDNTVIDESMPEPELIGEKQEQ